MRTIGEFFPVVELCRNGAVEIIVNIISVVVGPIAPPPMPVIINDSVPSSPWGHKHWLALLAVVGAARSRHSAACPPKPPEVAAIPIQPPLYRA